MSSLKYHEIFVATATNPGPTPYLSVRVWMRSSREWMESRQVWMKSSRMWMNHRGATILGSIQALADTVEAEGWQRKQC
jgi:hypothetical protein